MKLTTEDRCDVIDVPGRDRQGRSWYSDEAKRSYLERYLMSGLSQRAFCEREGLKLPTFSSWLRRENKIIP
jgi:transposase-like protein